MNKTISGGVVHELPDDLNKSLKSDTEALSAWESLTPLARNEWICWCISVKQVITRKKHIDRMVDELKDGVRRPCCWIGCVHRKDKPMNKSQKWFLS